MSQAPPTPTRGEFSLRGLQALNEAINADPSLVAEDWRAPFFDHFAFTETQRGDIDALPDAHVAELQEVFQLAAEGARKGQPIELRVISDLSGGQRRQLQIVVPVTALGELRLANEKVRGPKAITWPIVCCCADCGNWHWCDDTVNPCV